jgi:long-subunit fatty acid transport protein
LDNLSVAAMWRVTYMTQTASQPLPGTDVGGLIFGPSGDPLYAKLDVSGWNFGGLQLGVLYRPLSLLRFGLSYRSKVVANGTGTTTTTDPTGNALELETRTSFTNPHIFRAGAALNLLQDRLLVAVDAKYLLYAEAYKTIDTTVFMNGIPITNQTPTHWKNAYSMHLGGEYVVLPRLRVRAGYELVMSATPKAYAQASMAPPGASHAFSLGLGIQVVDHLSVDLAGIYIAYETRVKTATANNAGPGVYASNTAQLALSASYRM